MHFRARTDLRHRPLAVEREQPRQDRILVDPAGHRIVPAVGGPDGSVERGVGVLEPGRTPVVEVGQRSLLQFGPGRTLRVEPDFASLVEEAEKAMTVLPLVGYLGDQDCAALIQ